MSTDDQFRTEIRDHLHDEVADVTPPHDLLATLHRRHTRRGRTLQAAVVGVPLVIAALAIPIVGSGAAGPGTPTTTAAPWQGNAASTTPKDLPLTGPKVQLAGYTVSLPEGFVPLPSAGPNGAVSAVGPDGSIELFAGAGDEFPVKGAEELTLGTHRAYLGTEPTTGRRELDVAFPSGTDTKYLVLRATGVDKGTLIKMASVYMTPHVGSPHPDCAPNCAGG